ncbi:MAG: exodeoxyribonuclease VII large subunit [Erysipelotrichaceae bacterium]|nr:exodeoxyribonuclease VII large subunit [Erysipelotrichaceae bacterium]
MSDRVISVSQLVRYVKSKLDNDVLIQKIQIEGELSNFIAHRSGHWYFSLKDAQSRINCVMFQSYAKTVKFVPKNGDKVVVGCSLSMFESTGQVQLYCTSMKPSGIGDLYVQFELLKEKLYREGLFALEHKKQIPAYPMRIGVIVGAKTAAREDIMTTLKRRWPVAEIIEFHSLVQGDTAHLELIKALSEADLSGCDVLILARGGGSIEDLWAFNNEFLARTIYHLNTPIVTGIGHEVDVTLADYVADVRAATPTAAAETVSPELSEVELHLTQNTQRLKLAVEMNLSIAAQSLNSLRSRQVLSEPSFVDIQQMKVDSLVNQLHIKMTESLHKASKARYSIVRCTQLMNEMLNDNKSQIERKTQQINSLVQMNMQKVSMSLKHQLQLLDGYSPLKILLRGYSIAEINGSAVHSIRQVQIKDELQLRLSDGILICTVEDKGEIQ